MSATAQLEVVNDARWSVTREGALVATIAVQQQDGETVVFAAADDPASGRPYRFDSRQAADAFLSDLVTSFSYLGCDVSPAAEGAPPA